MHERLVTITSRSWLLRDFWSTYSSRSRQATAVIRAKEFKRIVTTFFVDKDERVWNLGIDVACRRAEALQHCSIAEANLVPNIDQQYHS